MGKLSKEEYEETFKEEIEILSKSLTLDEIFVRIERVCEMLKDVDPDMSKIFNEFRITYLKK